MRSLAYAAAGESVALARALGRRVTPMAVNHHWPFAV
jgi:hypothetical protein